MSLATTPTSGARSIEEREVHARKLRSKQLCSTPFLDGDPDEDRAYSITVLSSSISTLSLPQTPGTGLQEHIVHLNLARRDCEGREQLEPHHRPQPDSWIKTATTILLRLPASASIQPESRGKNGAYGVSSYEDSSSIAAIFSPPHEIIRLLPTIPLIT